MWRLLLLSVPLMGLEVQMCEVPHRYVNCEAALLYWTTCNGTLPYATVQGKTETLQPEYRVGFQAATQFFWPASANFVEARFANLIVRGNGAIASTGQILAGNDVLDGGSARADTRQHYVGADLLYSICIYDCDLVRSAVFGGMNYTRVTDELNFITDGSTIRNVFTRSKFEGAGPRFGMSAQAFFPFGFYLFGQLAIRTPVGRRSLGRLSRLGTSFTPERGADVVLSGGFDGKLCAALQMLHCCILYRAELGYEMVYFFQMMNRRDLTNTGFGQHHAGRDIGFAGPYASLSVAF